MKRYVLHIRSIISARLLQCRAHVGKGEVRDVARPFRAEGDGVAQAYYVPELLTRGVHHRDVPHRLVEVDATGNEVRVVREYG